MKSTAPNPMARGRERGIVLMVALMLLIVLSLISIASVRTAGSTEIATNNARLQALSTQAAEAALRHCENGALNYMRSITGSFQITPQPPPATADAPYNWQDLAKWDDKTPSNQQPGLQVLTDGDINKGTDKKAMLYKRLPECVVQYQYSLVPNPKRVVVTARGFGPDVSDAGDGSRRPNGSEVWLQSSLQID